MNEVPDVGLPECKADIKISPSFTSRAVFRNFRTVLSRTLPLCFTGATPPRPDPSHPPSAVSGVIKRFGYKVPGGCRQTKRKFKRFVQLWLKKNLRPLTEIDIPMFETWLDSTPYTEGRKEELRKVWNSAQHLPLKDRFRKVKSFIKDETYPDWKYPRIINSRVDDAKCYFGPVVQAVSDVLFSRPEFIKTVPVAERPMFIRDLMDSSGLDNDYTFTDYTAFEAHFVEDIMMMTQVELFKYMVKPTSYGKEWLSVYTKTMTGTNELSFKHFGVKIKATRMSGEMDTSLSNGFSNLMLFLFAVRERGGKCVGVVEGDDGLFKVSPASAAPTIEDFKSLGFTIKIEHTKNLSEASFCGQVYDMTDLIVVTDPLEVIARIGFTNKKYTKCNESTAMQLLRAKGYSLVYQYHRCPMLDALGQRILELTAAYTVEPRIWMNLDQWERSKLIHAMNHLPDREDVPAATRQLVEKLYGVTEAEQKAFENKCSTLELGFHEMPCIERCPASWRTYYEDYSTEFHTTDPCWLLKPESKLLDKLATIPNCERFLESIR